MIGDDWSFDVRLTDASGQGLDLQGLTLGATYLAPLGASPHSADVTQTSSVTSAPSGLVHVLVPRTLTSTISNGTPARRQALAHVQIFTVDGAGLKTTRLVILVDAVDPSAIRAPSRDEGDGDYARPRGFDDGESAP